MGRFFSFSPEDATQLHFPSLPGEKTSLKGEERGAVGGHLDWTGLKEHFSLHQKGSHPGHPAQFAAVSGLGQLRVAPLEVPIRTAMRSGSFKSTKRRRGLCLFPSEDVCQRSPDLYPHTVSFAHFLNIFPFRQTGHTFGAHVIWQWRQVTKPDTRRTFQNTSRWSRGIICPSIPIISLKS